MMFTNSLVRKRRLISFSLFLRRPDINLGALTIHFCPLFLASFVSESCPNVGKYLIDLVSPPRRCSSCRSCCWTAFWWLVLQQNLPRILLQRIFQRVHRKLWTWKHPGVFQRDQSRFTISGFEFLRTYRANVRILHIYSPALHCTHRPFEAIFGAFFWLYVCQGLGQKCSHDLNQFFYTAVKFPRMRSFYSFVLASQYSVAQFNFLKRRIPWRSNITRANV